MPFLGEPVASEGQEAMYAADIDRDGYVWDNSRLWAHEPSLNGGMMNLISAAATAAGLSVREKAMLVLGQAATIGDSYCSVAWSRWLTEAEGTEVARAAVQHDEAAFDARERALARWARSVAGNPNRTSPADVDELRDVGFEDREIFALTLFTALRMALSVTNDALGARPDAALVSMLDPALRAAITWGRLPE
jgi:alkylhydroperoxidase family enzyme